uniref:Uncharacterized protein n=1 Tax=Brassica oleracea var. oleracea TaxID=109376 RepID=A0A0D3BB51_BRAOL
MAHRRKPTTPTYAQLFGDGSGTSSSGPSSSDAAPDSQTSQRVSSSPPLPPRMPPPPPPAAAPQPVPEGLRLTTVLAEAFRRRLRVTTTGHIRTGARHQITLKSRGLNVLR